ncbi:hypothetical protein [Pseudomonas sp. S2_C03]
MFIETKNWTAQISQLPDSEFFRTDGTVIVPHAGVTPRLVMTPIQDKSFNLRLELKLDVIDEPAAQIRVEKSVEYVASGKSNVTGVDIFFEGALLHHIDTIIMPR